MTARGVELDIAPGQLLSCPPKLRLSLSLSLSSLPYELDTAAAQLPVWVPSLSPSLSWRLYERATAMP